MKLDEATAVLRPRSAWEAVDLGCALARRHWGKLMRGWLTVALPLWAIIALVFRDSPGWACFAIWLTKPVLTRQPIFFLSRALFGPPPRARDFWREWKSSLWRGMVAALTYKRLSFQRSFRLPVIILDDENGGHAGDGGRCGHATSGSSTISRKLPSRCSFSPRPTTLTGLATYPLAPAQ